MGTQVPCPNLVLLISLWFLLIYLLCTIAFLTAAAQRIFVIHSLPDYLLNLQLSASVLPVYKMEKCFLKRLPSA